MKTVKRVLIVAVVVGLGVLLVAATTFLFAKVTQDKGVLIAVALPMFGLLALAIAQLYDSFSK